MKKIPIRMCVMCREKSDKRSLLRIIRNTEGRLEFDPSSKKNGRGAYLCAKDECLDLIKNRKKIVNALEIDPSEEQLMSVASEIKNYLLTKK